MGFMLSKTPVSEVAKKVFVGAGYVGTVYGLWDAGGDLLQGKIMGALIDAISCVVSAVAGYGFGVAAAAAALITAGAIGAGIGISILVSYAEENKNWCIGGKLIEKYERYICSK